ncbi:cytochrome P450 [Absidia repens]|uniref:Cytochrome P450 n=1 Tax=Absidia repens TaxID=90262 RepID=A0A1X2IH49_9FUNG|nr:cytochrome P450 [Absidia repens]
MKTATLLTAGATLLLSALAVKYPNRPIFTEDREDIPSICAHPLVGITPTLLLAKDIFHQYLFDLFEKVNVMTLTGIGLGMPRSIMTIDPRNVDYILKDNFENYVKGAMLNDAAGDLLGHGIFNANGEAWKYQRKTAASIFNTKKISDQFTTVFLTQLQHMNYHIFDTAADNGQPLDFHDTMLRFTLNYFMEIGFGVELNALSSGNNLPFIRSFDICQANVFQRFANPAFQWTETLSAWFMPWKTTIAQHLDIIDDFAYGVIEDRQRGLNHGEERNDLLSKFMETTNEHGQKLSKEELRDVVLNFVIAGRDTTAQTISWMVYSLLTNPLVQSKLMAEIKAHITDELYENPVTIFYETLRLYPGVPANQKYALNDDIWPDGTVIKKNDYVLWSAYGQGRSRKIWGSDAKDFKPERWFTAEGDLRRESPGKWPAFNAGRKAKLATLEALVAVVTLLRKYELTLVPNQEITYRVSTTLPMKNGMNVYVKTRT